jgi:hypothetical protein
MASLQTWSIRESLADETPTVSGAASVKTGDFFADFVWLMICIGMMKSIKIKKCFGFIFIDLEKRFKN